jgi:Fe-S cluster assembly ATPase SufC
MVVKKIIEEIFSRFGVPKAIMSDNGPGKSGLGQVFRGQRKITLCV